MEPVATLHGVRSPHITRPGDEADGAIDGQRLRNPLTKTQSPIPQHTSF